jgi:hypothetical protein
MLWLGLRTIHHLFFQQQTTWWKFEKRELGWERGRKRKKRIRRRMMGGWEWGPWGKYREEGELTLHFFPISPQGFCGKINTLTSSPLY